MLLRLHSGQSLLPAARVLPSCLSSTRRTHSRPSSMAAAVSDASPSAASGSAHGLVTLSGATLQATLRRLGPPSSIQIVPHDPSSPFVRPASVLYQLDGKTRRWDIVASHASVGIVVHHTGLNAFLLVRQFRPAVYAAKLRDAQAAGKPAPDLVEAFTYELCAGIVDKPGASLQEIAAEEVAEECGFHIAPSALRRIASAVSASGTSGTDHVMYFAQVDESMRAGAGGGLVDTGEAIEVLALPVASTPGFVTDDALPKSPGLMFGLLWAWQAVQQPSVELGLPAPASAAASRAAAAGAGAAGQAAGRPDGAAGATTQASVPELWRAAAFAEAHADAAAVTDAAGDGSAGLVPPAAAPPTDPDSNADMRTQGMLLRPLGAECDEPLVLRPVLPS